MPSHIRDPSPTSHLVVMVSPSYCTAHLAGVEYKRCHLRHKQRCTCTLPSTAAPCAKGLATRSKPAQSLGKPSDPGPMGISRTTLLPQAPVTSCSAAAAAATGFFTTQLGCCWRPAGRPRRASCSSSFGCLCHCPPVAIQKEEDASADSTNQRLRRDACSFKSSDA